jgi:hypothetical protein
MSLFFRMRNIEPNVGKWTSFAWNGNGKPDIILGHEQCTSHVHCEINEEECLGGSDHRPMWVQFKLPHRIEKMPFERWDIRKLDKEGIRDQYVNSLKDNYGETLACMKQIITENTDRAVTKSEKILIADNLFNVVTKFVERAAENSMGKGKYSIADFETDISTEDIQRLEKDIANASTVLCEQDMNAIMFKERWTEHKELCKQRNHAFRKQRKIIFQDKADMLADPKKRPIFQKLISCMRNSEKRKSCLLDPNQMDRHMSHFKKTFGAEPTSTKGHLYATKSYRELELLGEPEGFDNYAGVTKRVLKRAANGKAPGQDGIFVEMLKLGGSMIEILLTLMFEAFIEWRVIPSIWKKANVVLIFKEKGNPELAENYRPISLTCIARRVYEKYLLAKFGSDLEDMLEEQQGGFRRNRSTLQQAWTIHEIMTRKPKLIHAFLDIKAAYDSIDRRILWHELKEMGVGNIFIENLQCLFEENKSYLCIMGRKSGGIACKRGLLQGSSLSPILFNIYINSLIKRINSEVCVKLTADIANNNLFFADDGALQAGFRVRVRVRVRLGLG